MKLKTLATVFASACLLTACSVRVGDLNVASTKNYNVNSNKFEKGNRVTGKSSAPVVIIPLGMPNMKTAIDNALSQNKCAVGLTDVVISNENRSFLFGSIAIKVEGTEIIDRNQPGCQK